MGKELGVVKFLEHFDKAPFRIAMERVNACTYVGEDGKKYIDGKKLFPPKNKEE